MIHILGAGSMGCLWAAYLNQSESVRFISNRANIPRYCAFSLQAPNSQNPTHHRIPCLSFEEISEPIETLLVCTKSYDALPALIKLKTKLLEQSNIVLFQNGLGSHYAIMEKFPNRAIFAAVTTEGAHRKSATEIIHAGRGLTQLGLLNNKQINFKRLEKLTKSLLKSGLDINQQEIIWPSLWSKLVINCAINPFSAIYNCPNGEVRQQPLFIEKWPELKHELVNLIHEAGYPLSKEVLEARVFDVMDKTKNNISSMLQDVRLNKRTEIEEINGFAYRFLASKGIEHQVNKFLWLNVKHLDSNPILKF